MKTKTCTKCKRELPICHFHVRKASPDGRTYHCKDCRRGTWLAYYPKHEAAKARASRGEQCST
jgi:hypothetical protein